MKLSIPRKSARRQPGRRAVAASLTVIALLVGACAGSTAPNIVPQGSTVANPSPSKAPDLSGAPPAGSLDAGSLTFDLPGGAITAAALAENGLRASNRAQAGLAGYLGPDATAFAIAMDAKASDGLWRLVDGASSAGVSPNGLLASIERTPASGGGPAAVPQPGMSYLGPWVAAMMLVDTANGDKAYSKSDHEQSDVAVGPNSGKVTTDSTSTVTPSGDKIIIDVTLKVSGEVNDANGHLVFRINGSGHAHVEIKGCPDVAGKTTASMEFSSSEEYFTASDSGGRSGHSWQQDDKADAQVFADQEANLDHQSVDMKSDKAVKGGTKAAGAGQTDLTDTSVEISESFTYDHAGTGHVEGGSFTAHNTSRADIDSTQHSAEQLIGISVATASKAAEKFWRSGKCIEVIAAPAGGDVAADSTTSVVVKVRHKFEGNELDKPVEATLAGAKTIEPTGAKVPAPATFSYTAGSKAGDKGDVTFKSVSNRGIGQTTVTFTVGGGWKIDQGAGTAQSIKGQKCGGLGGVWSMDSVVKDAGIDQQARWTIKIDGKTLVGTYSYKSVTKTGGAVNTETASGKASIAVAPDGSLKMTLGSTTAKGVVVGFGSSQTVFVPVPTRDFTWTAGGSCPAA